MSFMTRTLFALPSILVLACGGDSKGGGTGQPSNPQCAAAVTCFETCLYCEEKDGTVCSQQCASATGGAPNGTGGATSSTGGIQGNGGVATGNGGTSAATGGVSSTGGAGPTISSYTFNTQSFAVDPGDELYLCQDFVNPFGKDIDILVSESFMTSGSHHLFAFRMPVSANSNLVNCPGGGIEFHEYVHTAQTPQMLTTYPPGIGRFMPASEGIRLMVHYFNGTPDPIPNATVSLRVDYVDSSQVTGHAAGIFLNRVGLSLTSANPVSTTTYQIPYAINLLGGASHVHKRGVGFEAVTSANEVVYSSAATPGWTWSEPPPNVFNPPLAIPGGSSITVTCNYNLLPGTTYTFGESADNNEMCIYSGVFYPSPTGASITQQAFF